MIGALGAVQIPAGWHIYVGSALGAGGIAGRVRRHLRPTEEKKIHWHIDTITRFSLINEVWFHPLPMRLECAWARTLAGLGEVAPPGFGASDCRCPGHLVYLPDEQALPECRSALEALCGAIRRIGIQ